MIAPTGLGGKPPDVGLSPRGRTIARGVRGRVLWQPRAILNASAPLRRVGARSQHLRHKRPHTLHRPAFLWSNRSEVWGKTVIDVSVNPPADLMPVTLDW